MKDLSIPSNSQRRTISGLFIHVGVIVACLSFPYQALAQRATEEDLVRSALEAEVRTSTPEIVDQVVEDAHRRLRELTLRDPQDEAAATVVFNRGQTPEELERLALLHGLEFSGVEIKIPVGEQGRVITGHVGARDLLLLDGTISERLRKAAGTLQFQLVRTAEYEAQGPAERMLEAAYTRDPRFFKVEVIGDLQSVELLLDDPSILAVFPDYSGSSLESYRARQSFFREARRGLPSPIIRCLEDGPTPGVPSEQIFRVR